MFSSPLQDTWLFHRQKLHWDLMPMSWFGVAASAVLAHSLIGQFGWWHHAVFRCDSLSCRLRILQKSQIVDILFLEKNTHTFVSHLSPLKATRNKFCKKTKKKNHTKWTKDNFPERIARYVHGRHSTTGTALARGVVFALPEQISAQVCRTHQLKVLQRSVYCSRGETDRGYLMGRETAAQGLLSPSVRETRRRCEVNASFQPHLWRQPKAAT